MQKFNASKMILILVILCYFSLFLVACSVGLAPKQEGDLSGIKAELISISEPTDWTEVASKISPAVVGVTSLGVNSESVGSGVCVALGGYVLTNSHVINGNKSIKLLLHNGTNVSAKAIYEDTVLDLAILKCNCNLPYLRIASSDDLLVGQDVVAVGTPLSLTLTHTFTKGIVSALNRTLKVGGSGGEGYMQNLIQHDASLNPGNSGGPLINNMGEVVGINTLKISSGEGIGFAIPSKSFDSLVGSFVNTVSYEVPYLGAYGYDSQIANYYGMSDVSSGFFVEDISYNSPLKELNMKNGSTIISFNGEMVDNALDLKNAMYKLSARDSVYVEYVENGSVHKGKIKLASK